jgi:hypothetical protein
MVQGLMGGEIVFGARIISVTLFATANKNGVRRPKRLSKISKSIVVWCASHRPITFLRPRENLKLVGQ